MTTAGLAIMAKAKPGDAASIERHRVALEKLRITEREKTKRLAIASFFGTIALGIIAWSVVRMTDRPPWLVFALAVLAACGGPSLMILRIERRLSRQIGSRQSILGEVPRRSPPGEGTERGGDPR